MINNECFTLEWINKVRDDNPPADPIIVEKTIYAFELLSKLSEKDFEFIFKGGTSLLLLIENPKRLSIDIDISTNVSKEEIESLLTNIINESRFNSWQENPRTISDIPKKHYKLYFDSSINKSYNSYILLDVIFQENPYPKTIQKEIKNRFIVADRVIHCIIPTADSILGDKLTAFAPNTTGIPFGVDKSMQIQKQLFDIGELFNLARDIEEIRESFTKYVEIESSYRNKTISVNSVIEDIIETSFLLSQILLKKAVNNKNTKELQDGISKLRSHLIGINYNLEIAKINAAKAAFIATSLRQKNDFWKSRNFSIDKISNTKLKAEYQRLENLKNPLPEAYYYWQKISEMT